MLWKNCHTSIPPECKGSRVQILVGYGNISASFHLTSLTITTVTAQVIRERKGGETIPEIDTHEHTCRRLDTYLARLMIGIYIRTQSLCKNCTSSQFARLVVAIINLCWNYWSLHCFLTSLPYPNAFKHAGVDSIRADTGHLQMV